MKSMKYLLPVLVAYLFVFAPPAAAEPVVSPVQDEATVLAFWSPDRMREAETSQGGPSNPANEVITPGGDHFGYVSLESPAGDKRSRIAGILFYVSDDDSLQHCSATVLASSKGDLVLTAAHCVVERDLSWKRNMMFVPAYNGLADTHQRVPLDRWPVRQAYIPQRQAHFSADTDIAIVSTYNRKGKSLQQKVGGASIPFIAQPGITSLPVSEMRGYPGVHYSGGEMLRCLSMITLSDTDTGMRMPNCSTLSGSSGSGFRFIDDKAQDRIIGVVHGTGHGAPLRPSTFEPIYQLATQAAAVAP